MLICAWFEIDWKILKVGHNITNQGKLVMTHVKKVYGFLDPVSEGIIEETVSSADELSLVGLSPGSSTTCGIRLESVILTWSHFGRAEAFMSSFWGKMCSVFDPQ